MSKLLFVMLSLSLLFAGCAPHPTPSLPATPEAVLPADTRPNETDTLLSDLLNICQLVADPTAYNGQDVRVNTTLVNLDSEQWFGDDNCPSRHPLFDAEFQPSFRELICNDATHFGDNLCDIVTPAKKNINLSVTATFSGRFEYYRAESGFTLAGYRFRLKVENITSISGIKNIEPVRLR